MAQLKGYPSVMELLILNTVRHCSRSATAIRETLSNSGALKYGTGKNTINSTLQGMMKKGYLEIFTYWEDDSLRQYKITDLGVELCDFAMTRLAGMQLDSKKERERRVKLHEQRQQEEKVQADIFDQVWEDVESLFDSGIEQPFHPETINKKEWMARGATSEGIDYYNRVPGSELEGVI